MTEDQWNDYLSRSKTRWVRIDDELLHSKAYRDLNYAPAIKVLNWFHEKIRLKADKKGRGKTRYVILNNGEFEFTYQEAGFRGLTPQKYRKAMELVRADKYRKEVFIMTEIIFEENGILNLGAVSKEEDLKPKCRGIINGPPRDGRCEVCGRHLRELKPFGGPGDPLVGDFSGELLVKIWRPMGPYDEEAEKAWEEAEKETQGSNNPLPWLITNYGKKKAEDISFSVQAYGCTGSSWECRDCIVLNNDEYFERRRQSFQEREDR